MSQRVVPVLCLLFLSGAHCLWQLSTGDGQPGCQTRYEMNRLWRNNLHPDMYWECRTLGEAAVGRRCAPSTFFLDHWQTCVPGSMYETTPTYDPPSSPESCVDCPPCGPEIQSTTTTVVVSTTTPATTTTTLIETTEAPVPFICTADRMGLRWAGDTQTTYWECYGLNEDPFLISCPPGFVFDFNQQTCTL